MTDALEPVPALFAPSDCVREALVALLRGTQQAGWVVNASGQLVGEISEGTCLRVLSSGAYHDGVRAGCGLVHDVMDPPPIAIDEGCDPFTLAERLLSSDSQLAAVMRAGRVVASVSRRGLLRVLSRVDEPACQSVLGAASVLDQQASTCRQERVIAFASRVNTANREG